MNGIASEGGKISTFETVINSLIKFNQAFRRSTAFVGNNKAAAKTDLADGFKGPVLYKIYLFLSPSKQVGGPTKHQL